MLPPTWQARWTNQSIRRVTPMATLTLEQTTFALPVSFCYILVLPDTNSGVSKLMAKTPQQLASSFKSLLSQLCAAATPRDTKIPHATALLLHRPVPASARGSR